MPFLWWLMTHEKLEGYFLILLMKCLKVILCFGGSTCKRRTFSSFHFQTIKFRPFEIVVHQEGYNCKEQFFVRTYMPFATLESHACNKRNFEGYAMSSINWDPSSFSLSKYFRENSTERVLQVNKHTHSVAWDYKGFVVSFMPIL